MWELCQTPPKDDAIPFDNVLHQNSLIKTMRRQVHMTLVKRTRKRRAHDINRSENQATTGLGESDNKEPLQTRTFANGMITQEVEMGKPDGKKATHGKKVSVKYIGKLKDDNIFYSNVSGRHFESRLGVGQVSGWDVGHMY
ncbi:Peptidyl-prolyl cis-trans isomerase FKBP53, partial [Zea mays]